MTLRSSVRLFKQSTANRYMRTTNVLGLEFDNMLTPYSDEDMHMTSLGCPFAHLAHMALDIFNLARGVVLLAACAASLDPEAYLDTIEGVCTQSASVLFDAMNCFLSTLAIITRTMTSIFSGYGPAPDHEIQENTYSFG